MWWWLSHPKSVLGFGVRGCQRVRLEEVRLVRRVYFGLPDAVDIEDGGHFGLPEAVAIEDCELVDHEDAEDDQ